jgi:hypothetical protein
MVADAVVAPQMPSLRRVAKAECWSQVYSACLLVFSSQGQKSAAEQMIE